MSELENNPKTHYDKGLDFFQKGDFKKGIKCFVIAAKKEYEPAIKELGLCYLHGISVKRNLNHAIKCFKNSRNQVESQYELAKLFFFGYGVKKDLVIAKKLLILAVKNNYPPALNLMAVCYKLSQNDEYANILFNRSLLSKDRFANHLSKLNLISEVNEDVGFVNDFNWPEFSAYNKEILNTKPDTFSIEGILSEIECEYIKYTSSPFMRESMIVNPETGQLVKDDIRTSYSATIDWLSEDPAINLIMKKCCINFDIETEQSEVLHVLHYSVGEEYKPHYDFFGGIDGKDNFQSQQQRIKTIVLYLNNVEEGGNTSFPKLQLSVKPQKGKAVFFENFNVDNNQPYIESLHAGEPVVKGEKWLATLWLRGKNTNRGPNYESI